MIIHQEFRLRRYRYKQRSQVFIVEDDHRGEVNEAVLDLRAFNPDKEPGDSLGWRITCAAIKWCNYFKFRVY